MSNVPDKPLSLREVFATDHLEDFIAQEEARGVGPVDRDELDVAVRRIVRGSQPDDRTSRSASRGGSSR